MMRCTAAPSTRHRRLSGWLLGLLALLSLAAGPPVSATPAGIDWQIVNYSLDLTWNSVAYGNGRFVAVAASGTGNRVMASRDGSTWTAGASAADSGWTSVTYGNGLFVAVASSGTGNRVMTSPDGIVWTARTAAAAFGWSAVTYGNGLFVAVANTGTGNRVMTSPDGITWTARATANDALGWRSITYGSGLFVAVASGGTGNRAMTSPDGISWTARVSANDTLTWQSVTYGNGLFVAVANTGTGNRVMTSPDGSTWTARAAANDALGWRSVTYGGGLFVAVASSGTNNRVMTSPDGSTWTTQTSAADNSWTSVTYGNGLFVAVAADGAGNRIMTSPDGSAWTAQTYPPDQAWDAITYGNGLFVAAACGVAVSQTCEKLKVGNRVMTSPDGLTWTTRTTPAGSQWTAVTYGKDTNGNGLFVAVASDGTSQVMTSPDGIAWTAQTAAANDAWRSVTYGNGRFVAVAQSGTNQVMTSSDGTIWAVQTAAAAVTWNSVAYGNNRFVAVASGGTGTRVMTSPDGIAWTAYASANDTLSWQSATYGNGQFVAVGLAGAVMTSPDGSTWTTRTAAAAINWTSVTYGDGLFVAVASTGTGNRVMTSPDGVTWTARISAANNNWTSVTYGNGLFVAVAWNGAGNRVMLSRNPCGEGIALPTAQWQMLAAPCLPAGGGAATVATTFGNFTTDGVNLKSADYATTWLLYSVNPTANAYVAESSANLVAPGTGYWIKTLTAAVNHQLVVLNGTATVTDVTTGCASANGCTAVTVSTVSGASRYNMVGNPFPYNVDWAQVRVRLNGSATTYTPSQAAGLTGSGDANPPVLAKEIWIWNGTGYDSYDDSTVGMIGNLRYFQSFWVKVLPGAAGQTVELLIPAAQTTHAQAAPGRPWYQDVLDWLLPPAVAAPLPAAPDWYVRLKVDNPATGWHDHNTVIGQRQRALPGYDPADLVELAPFAAPYLTMVLPHPEWGAKAGDYASDLRPADGKPTAWTLEVRANPVGSQVVLRWEGDPAVLARSALIDSQTGRTIVPTDPNYADGYPVTLTGKARRFVWRYLGQ